MQEVYEPREDSHLLAKFVKKYAKGVCLDVGTGTGIQAKAAALKGDFVIAVDINPKALEHCNSVINSNKILTLHSNLFSFFEKKYVMVKGSLFKGLKDIEGKFNSFDTIIFNPPYLPQDKKDPDVALDGGKKGYEIIRNFLRYSKKFLAKDGIILMIFSSFTDKEKVDSLIKKNGFSSEQLEKKHVFFEDIYCYKIKR